MLSNTNEIHIKAFTKILLDTYGENIFEKTFEKIYYSCRMKMRKPDAEIFEYVLKENNLIATETLFVDDSEQHIKAAEKMGINKFDARYDPFQDNLYKQFMAQGYLPSPEPRSNTTLINLKNGLINNQS